MKVNRIKKKLLNTKWVIVFILFILLPPAYLKQLGESISFILNLLKAITAVVIAVFLFEDVRIHLKKHFLVAFFLLWAELFFATLISKQSSAYIFFWNALLTIPICMFIAELAIHSPQNGVVCLYYFFTICTLLNTITFLLFPGALYADVGGWRCWLLADDNTAYSYYILASTLAMVYCSTIKERITVPSVLVWISGFVFAFGRGIGSGMICQVVWSALFIIYHFRRLKQVLKARYVLLATAVGFLGVVVLRNLIFESIATAVGKDITLSGRTRLWDSTIKVIMQSPLFGYGMYEDESFQSLVATTVPAPHNHVLSLMYWGGIVAVALFGVLIFVSAKDAAKAQKTDFYKAVVIGLVVISIRLIVESGNYHHLYLLLTLLAYSPEFIIGLNLVNTTQKEKSLP